jgi:hypothetical protein
VVLHIMLLLLHGIAYCAARHCLHLLLVGVRGSNRISTDSHRNRMLRRGPSRSCSILYLVYLRYLMLQDLLGPRLSILFRWLSVLILLLPLTPTNSKCKQCLAAQYAIPCNNNSIICNTTHNMPRHLCQFNHQLEYMRLKVYQVSHRTVNII